MGYDDVMQQFTTHQQKDLKVLIDFVTVYCHARHERSSRGPFDLPSEMKARFPQGVDLCTGCAGLLAHGIQKRRSCPLDPKPSCKRCHVHCYSRDYRAKVREVMGFSGRRMILRGRIDYLWHYLW
jgi:uncharacterized paraquat-inducible protein A